MTDTKEKLDKGWIQARILIEIIGKPKEHVEEAVKVYSDRIKADKDIEIINLDLGKAEEVKDMEGFFGALVELEVLMPSMTMLASFCFDYMPASIEIIEPDKLNLRDREVSAFMNDLLQKLHTLDMAVKQTRMENQSLKKNTHLLLNNVVNLMLMNGDHTAEELGRTVGLDTDQMEIFLEKLVKDNKLDKEGDRYKLPKKDEQ